MPRSAKVTAALLLAAFLLSACGKTEATRFEDSFFGAFDCTISVIAYCENREDFDALLTEAESEFLRYHKLFDIYTSYPGLVNLKTVNDSAGETPVAVSPEIMDLLKLAKEMYTLTGGRVNAAMGRVLRIWHDIREYNTAFPNSPLLPDRELLENAAEHCSMDALILDESAGTVFFADDQMSLDVGAIAKGYATECVAQKLLAEGYTSVSINAGGNVRVLGKKPDGSAWNIGITDPEPLTGEKYLRSVPVMSGSVVTSGVYQRFFVCDGRRYHHIIDGETLYPENRYLSLSVVTENSGRADALSTALFNTDYEEGAKFVAETEGLEAMWIFPDGTVKYSDGF